MHYIGVDYHKRYSYIVIKNLDGRVERKGSVSNEKGEIQRFVAPCRPGKAVVEATRNWHADPDPEQANGEGEGSRGWGCHAGVPIHRDKASQGGWVEESSSPPRDSSVA